MNIVARNAADISSLPLQVSYDAAKLLHSIDGGYDFLIHDMFVLKQHGTEVELQQFFPPARDEVLARFAKVFGSRFDLQEVRLLEGLEQTWRCCTALCRTP